MKLLSTISIYFNAVITLKTFCYSYQRKRFFWQHTTVMQTGLKWKLACAHIFVFFIETLKRINYWQSKNGTKYATYWLGLIKVVTPCWQKLSVFLFFVRVHLKFMVLVICASNFAATAATTHKSCILKIFHHLQRDLYQRIIGLG